MGAPLLINSDSRMVPTTLVHGVEGDPEVVDKSEIEDEEV